MEGKGWLEFMSGGVSTVGMEEGCQPSTGGEYNTNSAVLRRAAEHCCSLPCCMMLIGDAVTTINDVLRGEVVG